MRKVSAGRTGCWTGRIKTIQSRQSDFTVYDTTPAVCRIQVDKEWDEEMRQSAALLTLNTLHPENPSDLAQSSEPGMHRA